jgi:hypothetical protein
MIESAAGEPRATSATDHDGKGSETVGAGIPPRSMASGPVGLPTRIRYSTTSSLPATR